MESADPAPRILERNKQQGLHYALTDDGVELPIIDITHPAFAWDLDPQEWKARFESYVRMLKRRERIPGFVNRFLLRYYRRHSLLLRGITNARGAFLSGMDTYLLKLGPENLGRGYSGRIDRKVAHSFPAQAARLRLREAARSIAQSVAPLLRARSGPLHLLNIAGGPAADSLNALMLLQKQNAAWLIPRSIHVHVLDLHPEAPRFGQRALASLQEPGAPLHGLRVRMEHVPYDWANPSTLRSLLQEIEPDAVVAGSSEGGLFHYASDEEVIANLEALRDETPPDFVLTGSIGWENPLTRHSRNFTGLATRTFAVEAFDRILRQTGWSLDRETSGLTRQIIRLRKVA
jgi:hypothetical protein